MVGEGDDGGGKKRGIEGKEGQAEYARVMDRGWRERRGSVELEVGGCIHYIPCLAMWEVADIALIASHNRWNACR